MPARIRLQVIHDSLGASIGFHYDVNVIGTNVGGQQLPLVIRATLADSIQHSFSTIPVETVRRLVHPLPLCHYALGISFDKRAAEQIMRSIYRTGFLAVQVTAVASERE